MVPTDQAMIFVSPIHVFRKPNKPGEIRITTGYRCLNKNLPRTRIVQNPKVGDYISKLPQCKYWFKFDLPHAYHQFDLDEESRRLTTMLAVWGNVRMKRLSMGLLNAHDFYHERMYDLLRDMKNTANHIDDITGGGKSLRSMIKTLSKSLQRLNENGLTLSPKKCLLAMKSVEFLGFVFIQDGLKAAPDKVKLWKKQNLQNQRKLSDHFLIGLDGIKDSLNDSLKCQQF